MHVSGITYTIDASMPSAVKKDENGMLVVTPGKYRVKDVTVGGEPLDPDRLYTVCSSDYILKNAGDGNKIRYTRMLKDNFTMDIDALADYIRSFGGNLPEEYRNPEGQGRIRISE